MQVLRIRIHSFFVAVTRPDVAQREQHKLNLGAEGFSSQTSDTSEAQNQFGTIVFIHVYTLAMIWAFVNAFVELS